MTMHASPLIVALQITAPLIAVTLVICVVALGVVYRPRLLSTWPAWFKRDASDFASAFSLLLLIVLVLTLLAILDSKPAAAAPCTFTNEGRVICAAGNAPATPRAHRRAATLDAAGNSVIVGGRPPGCPHRFCGCEASLYVFGEIRKDLNLAANWARKFPRTQPAPGMVAARSGHVFVLMSHVEGNQWLVHDGNSGGGKSRRHVRSIAGYAVVNPHASSVAQAPTINTRHEVMR